MDFDVQFLQRRDARRHRQRIAAQRAGLINRAQRREQIHDVRAPAERAHRQAAADDFAEARQIRRDAEPFLRAARRQAETGHHFVENQQRAVRLRDLAQKFQIARFGQIKSGVARHRLDDDAGDLIFVRAQTRPCTASTSLNGRTMVCCVNAAGTPALSGWPNVSAPLPALTSSESAWP